MKILAPTIGVSLMLMSAIVVAQTAPDGAVPRQQVIREFDRRAPAVGEVVPDLQLYDANGKKVALRSLIDRPTVLVFGCLT